MKHFQINVYFPNVGIIFWEQVWFDLKIASLGLLLVWFLVEIWSYKSLILRFLCLTFCLAALLYILYIHSTSYTYTLPLLPTLYLLYLHSTFSISTLPPLPKLYLLYLHSNSCTYTLPPLPTLYIIYLHSTLYIMCLKYVIMDINSAFLKLIDAMAGVNILLFTNKSFKKPQINKFNI